MQAAINSFQKKIFFVLLYLSAFSGYISDIALDSNRTALYALFDSMMVLLGILSFSKLRGGLAFILIFTMTCIFVNFSYSDVSFYASLNGARDVIVILAMVLFFNKVFAPGNEDDAQDYINMVKTYGFIFLLAQIPVAFLQYLKYGPSDAVGGTLGFGGSGVLTMLVICLVYYLHFFSRNIGVTLLLYVTLLPLFLNETKISFVLIPMMVLFVRFQPKAKNILFAVGAAVVFFLVFNTFYSASYLDFDNSAAGIFSGDFLKDYLMADIYTYDDIPRFTKIVLAWNLLSQQVNTFLFGMEYGLFKGGSVVEVSRFALNYQWLLNGTRPYLFFLMMQGGMLLVTGIMWIILYINRYFRNANKFNVFLFIILLLMLGYNDALRNQHFISVYLFLVYYANSKFYTGKPEDSQA